MIAFASLWYMEYVLKALEPTGASGSADAAERKKLAEMLEPAKAAFQAGQYERVTSLASHVRTLELQSASRLASASDWRFNEIEVWRDFWGWLVLVFYVIGAGLVGFAFVRSRLRARAPSEPTTYIDPPYKGRG